MFRFYIKNLLSLTKKNKKKRFVKQEAQRN